MATGLLLDKRLSVRTLRDSRLVVDEAACTGSTFTTLLNPDGDGKNYRLGTWLVTGYMAVLAAGPAEVFAISGGTGGYGADQGAGGRVLRGTFPLPAGHLPVTVGAGGLNNVRGTPSSVGSLTTYMADMHRGAAGVTADADYYTGIVTRITGVEATFGKGNQPNPTTPNTGDGGLNGVPAASGIVIARWEI